MTSAARIRRRGRRVATAIGGNRAAQLAGSAGMVARSVFYLLLAYLTVRVATEPGGGSRQANAHGALSLVARDPLGRAAIVATAAGFLAFGVTRLAGAARDRGAPRWRRVTTALQGAFYVALTWVPLSFALGRQSTGSEQQQHAETARALGWPGGRELVVAIGAIVVLACAWQVRTGLREDFMAGLDLRGTATWVRRLVRVTGVVGIVARALVFVPIGVFLVVAAVQFDPRHANGLDHELAALARQSWWGPAVLALVAAGLVVFAVYSALEARYRRIGRGR